MPSYNLQETAKILGIKPRILEGYIGAMHAIADSYQIERRGGEWAAKFNEGYGEGAYERLMGLFINPCTTFEQIAAEYRASGQSHASGTSVSNWHDRLFPGMGQERYRLCTMMRHRQALFADEVVRSFYKNSRRTFPRENIEFFPIKRGFRTKAAKLNGRKVLLKSATRRKYVGQPSHQVYQLVTSPEDSDFVFYLLEGDGFLFVPRHDLPPKQTLFQNSSMSKYYIYKNNFDALLPSPAARIS